MKEEIVNDCSREQKEFLYKVAENRFVNNVRHGLETGKIIFAMRKYDSPEDYWLTAQGWQTKHLSEAVRITAVKKGGGIIEVIKDERVLYQKLAGSNIQETRTVFIIGDNGVREINQGSVFLEQVEDSVDWLGWDTAAIIQPAQIEGVYGKRAKTALLQQTADQLQFLTPVEPVVLAPRYLPTA